MTIRIAEERDRAFLREALALLDTEMQALYHSMTGDMLVPPDRSEDALTELLTGNDTTLLVAETDAPAGFALVRERGPGRLNLDDLEVLPADRRQGIGTALVEAVKDLARAKGCTELTLQAFTGNEAALHLYERLGFVPTRVLLRTKV